MKMEALNIRAATTEDCGRLIPLINAAFAAAEHFMTGPRTDPDRLGQALETGTILVAEDAQRAVLASVYTELRGDRGYIGMLAVDVSRQGVGLGRRMMEAAEEYLRARGCQAADITVLSLRPELPTLYRKLGYVETGTQEFHYPHPIAGGQPCHCIVLSKAL